MISPGDFTLNGMKRSGVDMKMGHDVASSAQAKIVDKIVLIASDTDFMLDPMGEHVNPDLIRQVDDIEDLSKVFDPNR